MATLKNTIINDTGYLTVPVGTTATRPGSPVNGQIRFNTDSQVLENYASSAWITPIVTTGLVMYLDPGNKNSYAGFGTTLRDITGNGNNALMVGSPTYSASYGGVLEFNGSNYASIAGINLVGGTSTVMGAARYTGTGANGRIIASMANNWLLGHWGATTQNYYAEGWVSAVGAGGYDTSWRILTGLGDASSDSWALYVNGALSAGPNANGSQGPNGLCLGGWQGTSEASASQVGFVLAYNRVLTVAEIQQNYNAFRARYSL
jgi:hypothetical protein